MRVFTTKFRGSEVNVIFNGSHYYFLNSYYGILAIAERDYDKTTTHNGECRTSFAVTIGNHHTVGGSLGGGHSINPCQEVYTQSRTGVLPSKGGVHGWSRRRPRKRLSDYPIHAEINQF